MEKLFSTYYKIKNKLISYPKAVNALDRKFMLKYNSQREKGPKKLFCYNPFVTLRLDTLGNAIACCRSEHYVLGKFPDKSLKEIWLGESYVELRKSMKNNILPKACEFCKSQIQSDRLSDLPTIHADDFSSTKAIEYPKILELATSYNCNFACIMCNEKTSSTFNDNSLNKIERNNVYGDIFIEQIKEFLPHLKKIIFLGGEPFLNKDYYKIWDLIIENSYNIKLQLITNGSIFNEKIKDYLEKLQFDICISLDSLNKETFEGIRINSNFDEVFANIEKFKALSNGNFSISTVAMDKNWRELPAIVKFCNKINARIHIAQLNNPIQFAIWAKNPDYIKNIIDCYEKKKIELNNSSDIEKYNYKIFSQWNNYLIKSLHKNIEIQEFISNNINFKKVINLLEKKIKTIIPNREINNIIFASVKNLDDKFIFFTLLKIIDDYMSADKEQVELFLSNHNKLKEYVNSIIFTEDTIWLYLSQKSISDIKAVIFDEI